MPAEPRPPVAIWELTLRCNGACRACGSRGGHPRENELGTGEALDLIAQLAEAGVREVTLIGGEAYLREDWSRLAAEIVGRGIACNLIASGRGFGPEQARLAKEAGLECVVLSIDGLETSHDALRGPGAFEAIRESMAACREVGLPLSANTQINRLSAPDLEGVFEWLVEQGFFGWQPQLTVPMGRAADAAELIVQPFELLDLVPRVARLVERGRARGLSVRVGDNLGYFGPHQSTLRDGPHGTRCGAGETVLGIESDGRLKPCASLPRGADSGNLREAPLAELLARPAFSALQSRGGESLSGFCRDCYYGPVCLGGCCWTATAVTGRPGDNPYCHHRALELRREGLRERVVARGAAPGEPFALGRFEVVREAWP